MKKVFMQAKNNYWIIDGCVEKFRTLSDAKHFISIAYTLREFRKYLLYQDITHYVGGKPISYVRIKMKNDKPCYGRPFSIHIINFL